MAHSLYYFPASVPMHYNYSGKLFEEESFCEFRGFGRRKFTATPIYPFYYNTLDGIYM